MGLAIGFGPVEPISEVPSYYVYFTQFPLESAVIIFGFARPIDAAIAMRAMHEIPINWDLPRCKLKAQWDAYGGREAVMKSVCEHLQW
jgi:hypothetical protein